MNENIPHKPLEPGVFQGTPEAAGAKAPAPRLIRTMKSDMAEAVKSQNETLVSIALAEEKKQVSQNAESLAQKEGTALTPIAPKRMNRIVVLLIVLFVVAGIVSALVFFLPKLSSVKIPTISLPDFGTPPPSTATTTIPITPVTTQLAPSLIPAQSEKRIEVDTGSVDQILTEIINERSAGLNIGDIKNIYFTQGTIDPDGNKIQKTISSNRLFIFVDAAVPEMLTRTLETPFMVGLIGESDFSTTPFLVLKVDSYETGLAGMLAWEKTMPRFFDTLFNEKKGDAFAESKFRDIVINGHDARIFTEGKTPLVYTFADTNTVVIAGTQTALEKLLSLLTK